MSKSGKICDKISPSSCDTAPVNLGSSIALTGTYFPLTVVITTSCKYVDTDSVLFSVVISTVFFANLFAFSFWAPSQEIKVVFDPSSQNATAISQLETTGTSYMA